jgi:hypothetical protein
MKHFFLKTTVALSLVMSFSVASAGDLESCLADNKDNPNKMEVCLDQLHKSMGDAKKQELQQKYNQSMMDINKQQEDMANRNPQAGPALPPASSSAPSSSAGGAPSATTGTPSTGTPSSDSTSSSTTQPSAPASPSTTPGPPTQKGVDVRPEPRDKPKGVQWY